MPTLCCLSQFLKLLTFPPGKKPGHEFNIVKPFLKALNLIILLFRLTSSVQNGRVGAGACAGQGGDCFEVSTLKLSYPCPRFKRKSSDEVVYQDTVMLTKVYARY